MGRGQSSEVEETRSPLVCACCMPGRSWDVAGSEWPLVCACCMPGAYSIAAPPAAGRAWSVPAHRPGENEGSNPGQASGGGGTHDTVSTKSPTESYWALTAASPFLQSPMNTLA